MKTASLNLTEDQKRVLKRKYREVDSNLVASDEDSFVDRIRKQLEFYFGDSNLSRDKFLCQLIEKDKRGCVDIEIFLKFNRIKSIFPL